MPDWLPHVDVDAIEVVGAIFEGVVLRMRDSLMVSRSGGELGGRLVGGVAVRQSDI